ncbi:MAG: ABC transporter permease [Gemmataceae bacterium]|nr:ABC transporter permease [Gemmataceae bacterium]
MRLLQVVVWKEWREHGLVITVLAVFGLATLIATALLAQPGNPSAPATDIVRFLGLGRLAAVMLVMTAGMVCGSALFANERENGTFTYLETLPISRAWLWLAKLVAGLVLTLLLLLVNLVTAVLAGVVPFGSPLLALSVYAAMAFAWGVLGSTWTRSTLAAVGVGVLAAVVTAIILLVPMLMVWSVPGQPWLRPRGLYLFVSLMVAVPLGLSWWHFTGPDRRRAAEDRQASLFPWRRVHYPLLACLWLVRRQWRWPVLILAGIALTGGLFLTLPLVTAWLFWLPLALFLGALIAVLSLSDEQIHATHRYWGEQRLPVVALGLTKLIGAAIVLGLLLLILTIPLLVRAQVGNYLEKGRGYTLLATLFRSPLFDELGGHGWRLLLLPAFYGFAAGWLCSLLIRKRVPAMGVAVIVGGMAALLWMPSLLAGGTHAWQLWTPPLIWLLTGLVLLPAWAKERLGYQRGWLTLLGGLGISAVILAGSLFGRIWEIPANPEAEADIAYVSSLPSLDANPAGRDMRTAAEVCARQASALLARYDEPGRALSDSTGRPVRLEERLDNAFRMGWPEEGRDPFLNQWLDALYNEQAVAAIPANPTSATPLQPWFTLAQNAAHDWTGLYEHPQLLGGVNNWTTYDNARRLALAVLARGLQLQRRGQPDRFPEFLHVTLGLIQHLRHGAPLQGFYTALEVERLTLSALERWLEAPHPPAWLPLYHAAQLLERHDNAAAPTHSFDPTPYFLTERYLLREAFNAPSQWLPTYLGLSKHFLDRDPPEVEMILLAWNVPWERERNRRLLGLGLESGLPSDPTFLIGRPGFGLILGHMRNPAEVVEHERYLRTVRRVTILRLALHCYFQQFQEYPPALELLVRQGLLAAVPVDPYAPTPEPIHYRLTRPEVTNAEGRQGELLRNPPLTLHERRLLLQAPATPPIEVFIPAQEPLVWSIGPDQIDQGGRNAPLGLIFNLSRPPDLVFLARPQNPR